MMGFTLWDELSSTPPKLSLSSIPTHKPPPEPPGMVTPPLQPTVSVPFQWEEAPGRPRPGNETSPSRPYSGGGSWELELPPRLLKMTKIPSSSNNILDGPRVGRSASDRFLFEGPGPKTLLGLVGPSDDGDGLGQGKSENDLRAHIMSCRWSSDHGPAKLGGERSMGNFDFLHCDGIVADMNIKVKIKSCKRSNGGFHRLSSRSYCLLESIYKSLKRMVVPKHKQRKVDTRA